MNIDRYKRAHVLIREQIESMRGLIQSGVVENAGQIAELIVSMSQGIKVHLATEDAVLYPALAASSDPDIAAMARQYQSEMGGIAKAFAAFVAKYRFDSRIAAKPEDFRKDANGVFRVLYERMHREDHELYVALHALENTAGDAAAIG